MFFAMSHLCGTAWPRARQTELWPRSAARKTDTNAGPALRRPTKAPTRVLSWSIEGELSAVALRQANEEVAISFILSLRARHAPDPRRHYNSPPPECNRNPR